MHRWSLHLIPGTNSKAAPFHVKHDLQIPLNSAPHPRKTRRHPPPLLHHNEKWGGGGGLVSAPPPPSHSRRARLSCRIRRQLLFVERCPRRQRTNDTSEIVIPGELNSDATLLRSTCHLDASVESIR